MPEKVKRPQVIQYTRNSIYPDLRVTLEAKSIFIMADTEKGIMLVSDSQDHSFSGQNMVDYATAAVVFCLEGFPPIIQRHALENILQNLNCHRKHIIDGLKGAGE